MNMINRKQLYTNQTSSRWKKVNILAIYFRLKTSGVSYYYFFDYWILDTLTFDQNMLFCWNILMDFH